MRAADEECVLGESLRVHSTILRETMVRPSHYTSLQHAAQAQWSHTPPVKVSAFGLQSAAEYIVIW